MALKQVCMHLLKHILANSPTTYLALYKSLTTEVRSKTRHSLMKVFVENFDGLALKGLSKQYQS